MVHKYEWIRCNRFFFTNKNCSADWYYITSALIFVSTNLATPETVAANFGFSDKKSLKGCVIVTQVYNHCGFCLMDLLYTYQLKAHITTISVCLLLKNCSI
jgi:hypothetical protein